MFLEALEHYKEKNDMLAQMRNIKAHYCDGKSLPGLEKQDTLSSVLLEQREQTSVLTAVS